MDNQKPTESEKTKVSQIPALLLFMAVIAVVAVASIFVFKSDPDVIQGEVDVDEYRVSSKVPSRVLEIRVKEGDFVHKGDTLVIMEAPEVEAKMQQAEAVQAAANAQSQKAENGARKEEVQSAYDMWQKAKAGYDIAQKTYDRVKRLADEGVMSQQKLDEATAQRDAASATMKAAKSQYDMAVAGARTEDKNAAKALVNQASGAVAEVNSYLNETILLASDDGEVTDIFPQIGELVGTGAPIMNIAKMNDMWVSFNVREDHLAGFKVGETITVDIPALNLEGETLEVFYMKDLGSYAAWKATKTTGQYDMKTFEVKARFKQKPEGIRPGMSVLLK